MQNEKLIAIGNKLDVSPDDIEKIKKERRKWMFLYPIIGAIVIICSTVIGYIMGRSGPKKLVSSETGEVYPFAISTFAMVAMAATDKTEKRHALITLITILLTLVLSIIGYATAYDMARPVEYYTGTIKYGVYSAERKI
ncbi:MAG: hypothetical protein AB1779_05850 [Candidatus Thermoplasmatota archaeon]